MIDIRPLQLCPHELSELLVSFYQVPLPKRANLPSPIVLTQARRHRQCLCSGPVDRFGFLRSCGSFLLPSIFILYHHMLGSLRLYTALIKDWLMKHALPRNDLFLAKRVLMALTSVHKQLVCFVSRLAKAEKG